MTIKPDRMEEFREAVTKCVDLAMRCVPLFEDPDGPAVSYKEVKDARTHVEKLHEEALETARPEAQPVDRSQRVMTDGSPETPDHRDIDPATGQQKGYVVLSEEERRKGFVRPVRRSYVHKSCAAVTYLNRAIAETLARDPGFYDGGTFCCKCRGHFPLSEFHWDGTTEQVGS
jgi:hypothetical protein